MLKAWGAPLGEPVAEDFIFLRTALFDRDWHLLDGGGSPAYWRPLSLQIYYRALGRLMLAHPGAVAALHALALALGALLLYRALRTFWRGPLACAAAAFPLLAESTRQLIAWPDHSSDLGLFFFSALAFHEATRRRLPGALAALLAALLCKELAVVVAVLLPFVPGSRRPPGDRRRWAVAVASLLAVWGIAYAWIHARAHLVTPQEMAGAVNASAPHKLAWALWTSLRAILSLNPLPDRRDALAAGLLGAILLVAAIRLAWSPRTRARLQRALPWIAWGGGWYLLASAALTTIFPHWLPNRSQFGSVGLGIALSAGLDAASPLLPAALLAARLALLALAPAPPGAIGRFPPETGSFVDFERLTRLQLLMREMRRALAADYPSLPRGSRVGLQYLPRQASFAFSGDGALQVWYGDTTLRWVMASDFAAHRDLPVATIAQFQAERHPQIGLVRPDAMRASLSSADWIAAGRNAEALAALDRARALQPPGKSTLFDGTLAGERAVALLHLGRRDEALREARAAILAWPLSVPARFVLAQVALERGDFAGAVALADSALAIDAEEPHLRQIRAAAIQARSRAGPQASGPPAGR